MAALVVAYFPVRYFVMLTLQRGWVWPGLLKNRHQHPPGYYVALADRAVLQALPLLFLIGLLAMLGWLAFRRPRRALRWTALAIYTMALLELAAHGFIILTHGDIVAYRDFSLQRLPDIFKPDPVLGFRLTPGAAGAAVTSDFRLTYRVNALGIRDEEIPAGDRRPRVMFLGDSQTFGEGVPLGERFSDRVGKCFGGVRTVNAGVPGYGVRQMLDSLRERLASLAPSLVVCCLIEADIDRSVKASLGSVQDHIITRRHQPPPSEGFGEWLGRGGYYRDVSRLAERALKKSWCFCIVSVRVRLALVRRQLETRDRAFWADVVARAQAERQPTPQRLAFCRRLILEVLAEMKAVAERAGGRLVVVNIDAHPIDYLEEVAAGLGLPYIDVSPALAGAAEVRYRIDRHYNSIGHARIAEKLCPALSPYIPNR